MLRADGEWCAPLQRWLSEAACRARWCDVHIAAGGRRYKAHRIVLSSASPFFKGIFLSSEDFPTTIVLADVAGEVVEALLQFLYNGEVSLSPEHVESFVTLTKALDIKIDITEIKNIQPLLNGKTNVIEKELSLSSVQHKHVIQNCDNMSKIKNEQKDVVVDVESLIKGDTISRFVSLNECADISEAVALENYKRSLLKNILMNKNTVSSQSQKVEPRLLSTAAVNMSRSSIIENKLSEENRSRDFYNFIKFKTVRSEKGLSHVVKPVPSLMPIESLKPRETSSETLDLSNSIRSRLCIDPLSSPRRRCPNNQVIASPWSAKRPICYPRYSKPSPSSEIAELPQAIVDPIEVPNVVPNDTNNNKSSSSIESPKIVDRLASPPPSDKLDISIENPGTPGNKARYQCEQCDKCFSQLRNYKYHLSVHRGTKEFAATCNVCGKYFNDRGYLSSHMKIHRNRKEYQCPHCPKSFNQRVAYNMHVRIHTGVKPHQCEECGKAFSRKMLLKQHARTHSGEKPYACSSCGKRFADRSNMTLHMRLHSGVKPFSCNLCPKSFTKKHHLKTHLNYHTGNKPYACEKCGLTFSQSSNMRTHMKKCSIVRNDDKEKNIESSPRFQENSVTD